MKFRLRNEKGCRAGRHIEKGENGEDIVYKAGDIIESEKDLCKIFGKKFEKIPTAEDFANPGKPNIIDKRFDSEDDEKEALQKRLDEINSGTGDDGKDSEIPDKSKNEDQDDTDDSEDTPDDDSEDEDDSDDEDDDSEEDDDEDEEIDSDTLGEDVTDKFPKAKDLGVQIYLSGKSWYVAYDPDDKVLLNEDGKKIHKKQMVELLDSFDDEE